MGIGTLEQAVIALGIKQSLFIKACTLELMIYVGGYYEIVFAFNNRQQIPVNRLLRFNISVEINMPCPPGSSGLLIRKRIEAAGIDVLNPIFLGKIKEITLKALSAVCQSGSCRQAGSCPYYYRICSFNLFPEI